MKDIIWTRAAADWESDHQLIGHQPVVRVPCRATRKLPFTLPANWRDFTICVTSPRSVKMLSADDQENLRSGKPVLTFGERTEFSLQEAGIPVERLDAPSGEAFANKLVARKAPRYAVLTSKQPAFPVAQTLRNAGIPAQQWDLYETISGVFGPSGEVLSEQERVLLAERLSGIVCLASPSAVAGIKTLLALDPTLDKRLQGVVIGKTTARALLGIFPFMESPEASLQSLWNRARELAQD